MITQLLSKNPSKRLGGSFDNIKAHGWFSGLDWDKLLSKKIRAPYVPKSHNFKGLIENALAAPKNFHEAISKVEAKSDLPTPRKKGFLTSKEWDQEF